MNVKVARIVSYATAFMLLLALGTNLRAQSAAPATPPPVTPSPATGLLSQAYAALSVADHDYQGHRIKAMKQIEAAAKELGVSLSGDGHGKEQQGTSDAQLKNAQALLQQAIPTLTGKAQMHVNKAIEQISTALSIK